MVKKEIFSLETDKCPECSSSNFVQCNSGEIVCSACGLVISKQKIDRGPEWRAFTGQEKISRSRTGAPASFSLHDKGLSTEIGNRRGFSYDASGKKIPPSTFFEMWRLKKWQRRQRIRNWTEKNLVRAMNALTLYSDKLKIPKKVKEMAAVLYRKAIKKGLLRGRETKSLVLACIYAACRLSKIPRTLREISEASLIKEKKIARSFRLMCWELNIKPPLLDPIICLSKIANPLSISNKTQGKAIQILHRVKEKKIQSKNPMALAAAALYCACLLNNERKTQKEIAKIARVTDVTIRNHYKELKRELSVELPQ